MNKPKPTGSWSGTRHSFPARARRQILRRDPDCQLAIEGVCTGASEEADHIVSHAAALAAGWDPADIDDVENGQGVCRPCHRVKTRAEQHSGRERAAHKPSTRRAPDQHPGILGPQRSS